LCERTSVGRRSRCPACAAVAPFTEVSGELDKRKPTASAIEALRTEPEHTNAILHVTC
jgi:hypothetical protein